ncbi:hypothetical protein L2E82_37598 [Cichorium intybus]|uniref:Uncharacterized protein n=1 Tax=Cichorium intybus TaxID=13427 RepID=A0ACB9AFP9_CICIN|nr:hypothetical protein L2E82_37598 [Cichorium intybus]
MASTEEDEGWRVFLGDDEYNVLWTDYVGVMIIFMKTSRWYGKGPIYFSSTFSKRSIIFKHIRNFQRCVRLGKRFVNLTSTPYWVL